MIMLLCCSSTLLGAPVVPLSGEDGCCGDNLCIVRVVVGILGCLCACGRLSFDPPDGSASGDGGSSSDSPEDGSRPACSDLSGQIMYLSFDEGTGLFVTDRSSGGHNAALSGGPLWAPGRFGGGMMFDGDNDELATIEMPATLTNLPALTACVWHDTIDIATTFETYFDKSAVDGSSFGWNLYGNTEGKAGLFVNTGAYHEVSGNPIGGWHHVCGTWDGGAELHVYVDGAEGPLTAEKTGGADQSDAANELTIANSTMNRKYPVHGSLDEVRLFDRALSATEVAELAACSP
jgi:hypothetical protein